MTEEIRPNEITNNTNNSFYIDHRRISVNDIVNHVGDGGNPRFGVVRDRLFHAMLVRLSLPYYANFPLLFRRIFEFITLFNAIALLSVLIYTHFLVANYPANCLNEIKNNWPMKGIVRIEVQDNLARLKEYQIKIVDASSLDYCPLIDYKFCHFDVVEILKKGVIPFDIKNYYKNVDAKNLFINSLPDRKRSRKFLLPFWIDCFYWVLEKFRKFQQIEDYITGTSNSQIIDIQHNKDDSNFNDHLPIYSNLFEFSLHYGLLRLNTEMRQELGVNILDVQLDIVRDKCLKDWREKPLMRFLIGIDELIMSSVKQLSENQTERGYLRDLISGELYHFVNVGEASSTRYFTALLVMLVFTFAISMLLRFSHDQIFVFIVDLFQMFEQNQPLIFPIAPLLTVILALVGMEAIMSEIFNDTTTAFYVILLVWMADQYDAIFCHSSIGRRYWLRFFYLYHFAFYAYQYHYNGVYNSLALLTSAMFTLHSMIYFFHHYELPHIIYQERLLNAVRNIRNNGNNDGNVDFVRIRQIPQNSNNTTRVNNNNENRFTNNVAVREAVERAQNQFLDAIDPHNSSSSTSDDVEEEESSSSSSSESATTNTNQTSEEEEEENNNQINKLKGLETLANSIVDEAIQEAETFVSSSSAEETQRLN